MRRVNGRTTARMRRLQKDKNRKQTTGAGKDQSWCDTKLGIRKCKHNATHKGSLSYNIYFKTTVMTLRVFLKVFSTKRQAKLQSDCKDKALWKEDKNNTQATGK